MNTFFTHPPQALSPALEQLALAAGIQLQWQDMMGRQHQPDADVLRTLFTHAGLACTTEAEALCSAQTLQAHQRSAANPWLTATVAQPLALPATAFKAGDRYVIALENGDEISGVLAQAGPGELHSAAMPGVPGYHQLHINQRCYTLAIAPRRCWSVRDAQRVQGLDLRQLRATAVQVYGLRSRADALATAGIGTYAALGVLAQQAAAQGLHGVLLSPLHAMFASQPRQFSPYSPSSRLAFNDLYVDIETAFGTANTRASMTSETAALFDYLDGQTLLDWPHAAQLKRDLARGLFLQLASTPEAPVWQAFLRFEAAPPSALLHHAWYEAIQEALLQSTGDLAMHHWHAWPASLRNVDDPGTAEFAQQQAARVQFHLFMQWQATSQYAAAREAATGMPLGLMVDLAVGSDPSGSHAWSRQQDMLHGVSIGAPPDDFNLQGQAWGLTSLSPHSMRKRGFGAFVELLRANMHGHAIRIDHAAGLGRLWLVPDGASAGQGAYLRMPLADMARLVALESWRQQCVVIGEDLGTVEDTLRDTLAAVGVPGLQPLLFQRRDGQFIAPGAWRRNAVAVTSTHDMAPLAGWWQGLDLHARLAAGLVDDLPAAQAERAVEKEALTRMLRGSGTGFGAGCFGEQVALDATGFVDAALTAVAATPSELAIAPLEDLLALEDEQNLPGTVDEYPNWRFRLPVPVEAAFVGSEARVRGWLAKG